MKHVLSLGNHIVRFKTYDTGTELDVLEELCCSEDTQDSDDSYYSAAVDDFLERLCDSDITGFSKTEKILLVWYIRSCTIGDDINVVFRCPKCGRMQQSCVAVSDLCSFGPRMSENPLYNIAKEKVETDFKRPEMQDLDYDTYLDFRACPEDFYAIFHEAVYFECSECGAKIHDNYLTYRNCLKFLSEDSFQSLTEWVNTLVYYGHYTRSDVLKMSPVQRMLTIEYFKKIKKKENGQETVS